MSERCKSRRAQQRGQTMALVAVSMISLLAMAALAIDVVTLYSARGQAERAADAAALAAAKVLADSGVTTDPGNASNPSIWSAACTAAAAEANNIASQNLIAGQTPSVLVNFPAFGASTCTGPNSTFGIDAQVTVQVTVSSLPTFFARIWSNASSSVSATAMAEAYNPSNSSSISSGGTIGPNAARCVKPMLVPNCDPNYTNGSGCGGGFAAFINTASGTEAITNPGSQNSSPTGVIGEQLLLQSACTAGSPCILQNPGSPYTRATTAPPSLAYYPISFPVSVNICPSCTPPTPTDYYSSLACCNGTSIECGQSFSLDTNEGGISGQTQAAGQCLIHESASASPTSDCSPTLDQDCLNTTSGPPYAIMAGTQNPLKNKTSGPGGTLAAGDAITVSDSVVTLPIYDNTVGGGPIGNNAPANPPATVTIIGFLQVFINDAAPSGGDMKVTVLNVTGCGNNPTGNAVNGSGPAVPVRLIHN
jgi:Flp pilus assembly protein TadG